MCVSVALVAPHGVDCIGVIVSLAVEEESSISRALIVTEGRVVPFASLGTLASGIEAVAELEFCF